MCSVVGCDSWRRSAQRFKLPEDPEKRLDWVQFLAEVNGQRFKESCWTDITICIEHFASDCYESLTDTVHLKPRAVPSLFFKSEPIEPDLDHESPKREIDINVIGVMTDEELSQYIVRYGDRLALRAFCRQRTVTNEESGGVETVKSSLMQKLRDRLRTPANSDTQGPGIGNKHAAKVTRRVEMGWLHFESGTYHQVRTRKGGGTRNLSVQKSVTMGELVETGKGLFFPNGHSSKGPMEDFEFDICDYSHNFVPHEVTVGQLYEQTKLRMLRIYTTTKAKDIILLSDESSDFEPTHKRPMKARTMKTRSLRNKTRRRHQVDHPESSSDLDLAPSGSMQKNHEKRGETISQSRSATSEMGNTEVLHPRPSDDVGSHTQQSTRRHGSEDDCLKPVPNQDADQLHFTFNDGPVSSSCLPASPDPFDKEILLLKLRRVNIVDDVLNVFMDPKVLNASLRMEFTNEKAMDSDRVSREAYSAFWDHFLDQCEGEDERVPRLQPDYSEKKWQALGRVWLKGYLDHKILPIRLSPAFVLACCQGVSSVDEELLMMSFARFLSENERASLEKALQGNIDETVEEDLLDVFSRMGSHCLPPKDNLRAAILTMAHKALLQEPKFIIDCFHSSVHNAMPMLITKDNIMELYESKRPTNKKVAQMIKPSTESLNPQEQTALNHLLRYVRSIDQRRLEIFLRFCTGSTVLCKDTIAVTFNALCGLSRRPVAHTCGAVLELPYTYSSYPEFRKEFDNVLSGDCFTMDIV
ncbi:uncharacterized protein LOC122993279 isoform X2 [Thunnus albacares]|uniref:uncharacterized protein LOC122993279 isoform X2 n=1 Tax=Thunnus albacares TaxID=8236 RepID=UPI001CF6478F|nr:uncharacterized protein LOC122993279 isoform X2 [Thunnus albacares]